ncbi:hypothetical protein EUX98_g9672, partial [Antrodiella citrinella]
RVESGMSAGQGPFSLNEIDLFVIHTLIHVSMLHLHRDLAKTQAVAYEKCWIAANNVISLVRELNDGDYDYLDPINSACSHCAADLFIKALVPPTSHTLQNANEISEQQVDVLIASMKRLGHLFPIAGTSHFTTHPLYHWCSTNSPNNVYTSMRGEVFDLSNIAATHQRIIPVIPQKSILKYGGVSADAIFPVQVSALCNGITGSVDPYVVLNSSNVTDDNAQYHNFHAFTTDYTSAGHVTYRPHYKIFGRPLG